jgi:hypothetical protein
LKLLFHFQSVTANKHRSNNKIGGRFLQTIVKKWFRDKDSGFLDNGSGPGILVRKADLVNCQFLKVSVTVEFDCHTNKQGLIAQRRLFFPASRVRLGEGLRER